MADLGWQIGAPHRGFGRCEAIERRVAGATCIYAAASKMRADGCALPY